MARKNNGSYAERHGEAIQNGDLHASTVKEIESANLNELDKPEVQAAILRPEKVTIELADKSVLEIVPYLTLGQLYEKQLIMVIQSLVSAFQKYGAEITGDNVFDDAWFTRNIDSLGLIVYKREILYIAADMLSLLTNKPVNDIRLNLNVGVVSNTFLLAIRILAELANNTKELNGKKTI